MFTREVAGLNCVNPTHSMNFRMLLVAAILGLAACSEDFQADDEMPFEDDVEDGNETEYPEIDPEMKAKLLKTIDGDGDQKLSHAELKAQIEKIHVTLPGLERWSACLSPFVDQSSRPCCDRLSRLGRCKRTLGLTTHP